MNLNLSAIFLVILLTAATCLHYDFFKREDTMQNMLCPDEATLDFTAARTLQECASRCRIHAQCRSFFYSKTEKYCNGVTSKISVTFTCKKKMGYSYYTELGN